MKTEYRQIALRPQTRFPGAPPASFSSAHGGSIMRVTEEGRDDVHLRDQRGRQWTIPWHAIAWAIEGQAGAPIKRSPRKYVHRVRSEPKAAPPVAEGSPEDLAETHAGEEIEEPEDLEVTELRPEKPKGEWKPPKPPRKAGQRRVSVPRGETA